MGAIARGQRIGRYELVQVLGEGGMGTVWLAHPYDAPNEHYAIKTVAPQYASDPGVCTMFVKEARLAAAIDHPNVVRLHDVGLHEGVPFYVMEWIDGFSLRTVAHAVADSGDRVPPGVALRIASDLCAGLHAAHELVGEGGQHLGLVHRDVSPHNVLVTREGVAKLIDFGVAKARDLVSGNDHSVVGGLKGKVRYMAPEQALDLPIDRRADLFSVGAVTYQLLTGRAPFEGPSEIATINALLATNPVFVPDELPEPVKWILRRALSRRPENRFADAHEMHEAIEVALTELQVRDTHADVAECLGWFDPRDEHEAITSSIHAASALDDPDLATTPDFVPPEVAVATAPVVTRGATSPTPPALVAAATPSAAEERASTAAVAPPPELQARPSVVVPPLSTSRRHPLPPGGASTNPAVLRFVAAGAGFVGVLVIGAIFLLRDPSPKSQESGAPVESSTQIDEAPVLSATPPASVSTTTPVVDMGDLDQKQDSQSSGAPTKPRGGRRTPRTPGRAPTLKSPR